MVYNFRIISLDENFNVSFKDYHTEEKIAPYVLSSLECINQLVLNTIESVSNSKYITTLDECRLYDYIHNYHIKYSVLFNTEDDEHKKYMCKLFEDSPVADEEADGDAYDCVGYSLTKIIIKDDTSDNIISYHTKEKLGYKNVTIHTQTLCDRTRGKNIEGTIVKLLNAKETSEKQLSQKAFRHNDYNITLFLECMDKEDCREYYENEMLQFFKDEKPTFYKSEY